MNERIVVHKLDEQGKEVWRYEGSLLDRSPTHLILEANYNNREVEVGEIHLGRGDRFVETFYTDRWYNIFKNLDLTRLLTRFQSKSVQISHFAGHGSEVRAKDNP